MTTLARAYARRRPGRAAYALAVCLLLAAPTLAAPLLVAQSPAHLTATIAPSPFLPESGSADVMASVTNGSGSAESVASVTVTVQGAGARLTRATAAQRAKGIVGIVRAGSAPGTASVAVSVAGAAIVQTLPVDAYARPADLLSGKGAWASIATFDALGAQTILARSAHEGVTHLYLEVAGINFVGTQQMDAIVQQAHNLGIAVIAWVYAPLTDVPAEIRSAETALAFKTALGGEADGLGGDFEKNLSASAMAAFSAAVRQALGPSRPYVGIIYPPQYGFDTPIATMARYVNVFAPMDYWLAAARPYTAVEAAAFVAVSMRELRSVPGEKGLPIEVISQTQDIENASGFGVYNPPPTQVVASTQAALADGAIGVSFYDLRTQTAAQISAIAALEVPSTSS